MRFYAESPARTRVELEHRHIDRHGPGWEAITSGVDGPQGWPLYLDRYAALVTGTLTWRWWMRVPNRAPALRSSLTPPTRAGSAKGRKAW